MALYPLTFRPVFKERVWGGRRLGETFQKSLPPDAPIGESWELTDRPEGVSVIANGPLAGRDLRWLMSHHGEELLGRPVGPGERFPWLIKLLDARDDLSLQVHPPASRAAELRGEPKTEMWYFAAADPGARIYVGLRRGVTRAEFERRLDDGTVAECLHVHEMHPGDVMFVPSGRVHALGRGNLVFEIQQNSDTTYRVFDWNRPGLDGRPRELHREPSLASIDFEDVEPARIEADFELWGSAERRSLVDHDLFVIDEWHLPAGSPGALGRIPGQLLVLGVVSGTLEVSAAGESVPVPAGGFVLLPASLDGFALRCPEPCRLLSVRLPSPARS
jgi:mannose-6-phosphate isomerase